MFIGHKYSIVEKNDDLQNERIDDTIETFKSTMGYEGLKLQSLKDFYERFDSGGSRDCHQALLSILDKDKLIVGLGSGYGEHEFMLHLKGYNIIASDIVPGMENTFIQIKEGKGFRHITLDALNENIGVVIAKKLGIKSENYDVLVTGMDAYFNETQLSFLFKNMYESSQRDSNLIFVHCYRDYFLAKLLEWFLEFETKVLAYILRKTYVKKEHGYRRSSREIKKIAADCGYICKKSIKIFAGYELYRSYIFRKLGLFKLARMTNKLFPFFHSRTVMLFHKKEP